MWCDVCVVCCACGVQYIVYIWGVCVCVCNAVCYVCGMACLWSVFVMCVVYGL